MSMRIWALCGAVAGFVLYFSRRVLTDSLALTDLAGTLGNAAAGAFIGLIVGAVLGLIFGKKAPRD